MIEAEQSENFTTKIIDWNALDEYWSKQYEVDYVKTHN